MEASHDHRDARTTPPWLRVPALLLCGFLIFSFVSAFFARKAGVPKLWIEQNYSVYWMFRWSMFTNTIPKQTAFDVEIYPEPGGEWEPIDLEPWFPARWESGLRFESRNFTEVPYRQAVFAAAVCSRMAATGQEPLMVRFTKASWRKTLGSTAQPREVDVKTEALLTWTCGDEPPVRAWGMVL